MRIWFQNAINKTGCLALARPTQSKRGRIYCIGVYVLCPVIKREECSLLNPHKHSMHPSQMLNDLYNTGFQCKTEICLFIFDFKQKYLLWWNFFVYECVCVCVHVACHRTYKKVQGQLMVRVFLFNPVGHRGHVYVLRFDSKCFYQMSHLAELFLIP